MMITWVHGTFDKITGVVDFDPQNPAQSRLEIQIAADSVNTRDPKRDGHLKSPDFFDAEKYPVLTFQSKRIQVIDSNHARLTGDLTIRDITHTVTLDVEYAGMVKSPWGSTVAGFTASTKINRKDWDLTWNVALETGGMLVGDTINIDIELELVKQEVAEAVPA